ncbi:helix-turn-helix transcriptional regulator [Clostridium celatum]|uniref:helix-turn-helix domain-containing protein n=1 Tax=Clostridium celatum TaxID=36834 RepID=UPI00319EAAFF
MDNNIGKNIRKLRIEKNFTQQQLATKSNVSLSALNKYERGERIPKIDTIEKLATALNVQIDYILGYSNFKRFDSQIMQNDIVDLIQLTDNTDKDFAKLTRNIVDTMYLTINKFVRNKDIETLTIIHDLYRQIWQIKMIKTNTGNSNLLDIDINTEKHNYEIHKKQINILLDKLYENNKTDTCK